MELGKQERGHYYCRISDISIYKLLLYSHTFCPFFNNSAAEGLVDKISLIFFKKIFLLVLEEIKFN